MGKEKHFRGGCLHCSGTEDILSMDTPLYQGFGGYVVYKNDEVFYLAPTDEDDWSKIKTLADIEKVAGLKSYAKWEVKLDLPLRRATWRRYKNGQWNLKETNKGFA